MVCTYRSNLCRPGDERVSVGVVAESVVASADKCEGEVDGSALPCLVHLKVIRILLCDAVIAYCELIEFKQKQRVYSTWCPWRKCTGRRY